MGTKREDAQGRDGAAARDGVGNRPQPRMPHERDESARATGNRADQDVPPSKKEISQAAEDVESGQRDTDRRGVPNDIPAGRNAKP